MSLQGFAVTAAGRNLFAKLTARSEPAEFTRVMFCTGKLADNEDIFNVTELVAPLAEGTSTTPEYKDDTVSMILEFRSDLNGGLTETVWINEYGLYASDPDGGEVLVCYGNLGDCPDSVLAFKDGQCTVRDYPISIVIGAVSDVSIDFPAAAFVTWEEFGEVKGDVSVLKEDVLTFKNISMTESNFTSNTDSDYPYKSEITCTGVTADHVPFVVFDKDSAATGIFAPYAETTAGKVIIYAVKPAACTIESIVCTRG